MNLTEISPGLFAKTPLKVDLKMVLITQNTGCAESSGAFLVCLPVRAVIGNQSADAMALGVTLVDPVGRGMGVATYLFGELYPSPKF